jgi:hypothetical protein
MKVYMTFLLKALQNKGRPMFLKTKNNALDVKYFTLASSLQHLSQRKLCSLLLGSVADPVGSGPFWLDPDPDPKLKN